VSRLSEMADQSQIEWTDATWNPIRGCSRVSEGCRNCYAERVAARFSGVGKPYEGLVRRSPSGAGGWTGEVRFIEDRLADPLHWKKPRRIFVNSMSDLFHEKVQDEWIDRIFAVMALCPQHTFQVLTKRPERMREWFDNTGRDGVAVTAKYPEFEAFKRVSLAETMWPLPNVWLGVSVEDQTTADERIPLLMQTPAAVRWVSYEPALGPVDFNNYLPPDLNAFTDWKGLDWIVAGGESGPGARPTHPDWFRSVRDQCVAAGVPFFFKQWGAWSPGWQASQIKSGSLIHTPCQLLDHEGCTVGAFRVGKRAAGRLLDGREWNEFPGRENLLEGSQPGKISGECSLPGIT